MKKIFTIFMLACSFAAAAMAVTVDEVAGTFKGTLNIGGTLYPNKEVYILPGVEANTITFVLPEFKYNGASLGDIVLVNILMDEAGKLTLSDATLFIKAISERAGINVLNDFSDGVDTYNSVITSSSAQVLLSIEASSLPEPILVLFTGAKVTNTNYELTNGGFEGNWSNGEPAGWHSFNSATGDYVSFVQNTEQFSQKSDTRPGSTGTHSAMIQTKIVVGAKANGNCTNGQINAGSMTADDATGNYNFSDPSNSGHNTPFHGNPDSLVFWTKYIPADKNPSNGENKARVHAVVTTNARYQDPEAVSYASVKIADAAMNYSATPDMGWQRIAVPFEYTAVDPSTAAYVLVTFSSNYQPGGGSAYSSGGLFNKTYYYDNVYLDDVEMVYNHALTSLTLNGEAVAFTDGQATSELVYSDSDYDFAATANGKAAKSFIGYDETNNQVHVYVVANNYPQARAYSLYTLQMAEPEEPVIPVEDTEYAYSAAICPGETYSDDLFSGLTEVGEYVDTIPNAQGGDSVVTLTLTVLPAYSFPTEAAVKMDESYTWRDKEYKDLEPGTYHDTVRLQTKAGCDSLFTLVLKVQSIGYSYEEQMSLCRHEEGTWRGKALPTAEAGEFVLYDSLKSVYGMDSVYSLTLTVLPTYSFAEEAAIKMDESYTWRDKEYKDLAPGTYHDTVRLQTKAGCDSLFTLVLKVQSIGYSYEEQMSLCRHEEGTWRGKALPTAEAGEFVLYDSLKSVYGMDSVYSLTLTVLPTYAFAETLHVNTIDTLWHGTAIKDLAPQTEPYIYHDSLLTAGGCDSVFTLTVYVSEIPVTYGTYTAVICAGEEVVYEDVTYTEPFDGNVRVAEPNIYGGDSVVHLTVTVLPNYLIDEYLTIEQGEDVYWEGMNLSIFPAGESEMSMYYYTIDGCDSTMVLHLTIEPKPISTGIPQTDAQKDNVQCTKVLYNGRLYIIRKDEKYTLLGTKIN